VGLAASPFLEPEEGGGYYVTVPALPGCFTRGRTLGSAPCGPPRLSRYIARLQADGEPVPEEVGAPQLMAITVAA
jgi:antitoxin HicB